MIFLKDILLFMFDFLVPRFITEEVAFNADDDGLGG